MTGFCCGLVALSFPAAAGEAPATADTEWGERIEWVGSARAGSSVTVDNPYGDVRARFGGWQGRVEVLANVQHLHPAGVHLRVDIEETESGVSVVVKYPPGTPTRVEDRSRADLAVLVPHDVDLDATTDGGIIDCKGLHGDVRSVSGTGDITLRFVRGAVRARSRRGSILAVLEPGVADQPQRLETRTGDVAVHLAPSADMTVQASTSGRICTDYSIDIVHHDGAEPDKSATAVVGEPDGRLVLRTLRGEIRMMRRLPLQPQKEQGVRNETE